MAHSVEVRLPFLSQQLVEYVFSLPPELIYQMGKTKFVLREATKKILPPAIYSRTDKVGFAPPEKQWILSADFKAASEHSNEIIQKSGLQKGKDDFRNFVAGNFISAFS
jgi:asparagine synthase (glutamine-hydrolysing)